VTQTFGVENMRVQKNIVTAILGTACLIPAIALAGPYDGPDTWSYTFPLIWTVGLVLWLIGPAVLVLSGIATIVHKRKRKGDSFWLLLRTFLASLVTLLLLYTVVLAVLFAFAANFAT
jgi:RsiW-degrading membrane proteinase PrsW (M82 family)